MSLFDRMDLHSNLINRMAHAVGTDLGEAVETGSLAAPDLRGLVLNCMACGQAKACAGFLNQELDGDRTAPGYCRNRVVLHRLAALR